uniref:Uncharacterized protein n=1 Tax=Arion vulgaris TaxID=1028688 RepID=A0A0B6Z917_9EUPU
MKKMTKLIRKPPILTQDDLQNMSRLEQVVILSTFQNKTQSIPQPYLQSTPHLFLLEGVSVDK